MKSDRDNGGRFRAGQTGNPLGRPKAPRSVDASAVKAFSEKVTVIEQGKRTRKSKLDISLAQVANKGAGGDLRAIKLGIDQVRKAEERAEAEAVRAPIMTVADREIADRVIARLKQFIAEGGVDEDPEA
tara:strand:+ start:2333 stop:2719 length:387 start_codon:yes stop_codon:yes gene_type:complete